MTHIYDDYDRCLSDTYAEMLRQADDGLGEWIVQLLHDSLPSEWQDAYMERMEEDVLDHDFLLDLLMKRCERVGMTQRERDIQRIGLTIVLNPFDRTGNAGRMALLRNRLDLGADAPNPPAEGGQDAQAAPAGSNPPSRH